VKTIKKKNDTNAERMFINHPAYFSSLELKLISLVLAAEPTPVKVLETEGVNPPAGCQSISVGRVEKGW